MHRTTILLPNKLKRDAERRARREGLSLSALIRQRLSAELEEAEEPPSFFSRKPWTESAPADLSAKHDDYLYGE